MEQDKRKNMLNNNSHRALSVGTLFPQKNVQAAKKAVETIIEKRIVKIVDQKTYFQTVLKNIQKRK